MKKKKNTKLILGVIVLVLVIGIFLMFNFGGFGQSVLGGGTVLSISQVNLVSSDAELGGKAYLVNVVANGGGELVQGTITPEQIQAFGIKEVPAGDFSIEMELQNYSCNYNLNSDGKTIYKVEYASTGSGCLSANPPYQDVSIESLKGMCKTGIAYDINGIAPNKLIQGQAPAGGNCDTMIHLNKLASWTPEETNVVGQDVICYLHDCARQIGSDTKLCEGLACYDRYRAFLDEWARKDSTRASYGATTCCVSHGANTVNVGKAECPTMDGSVQGDWVVTEMGGIPFYQGYKIDTATEFDYTVKITIKSANGQQVMGVITPTQTSANLNNVAIVKFVGNLLNNKMCPVPAVDNVVVKDVVTQKMKVVDKVDYDSYTSELDNLVRLDIDHYVFTYREVAGKVTRIDPAVGGDVIFEKMSNLNNKLTNMYITQNRLNECEISPDQTKLICQSSVVPVFPELQMKIRADWLGIYTPVGQPLVMAVTMPAKVNENTFASTTARIKNTGASDSFNIVYDCGGSAQVPIRETIAKDEIKTVTVPLFATYGNNRCTLNVVSVNDATKKSSYVVNVMVEQSGQITDVLNEQTLLKQQLLSEVDRLWLQYANASTYDQTTIREQINQVALRMDGILVEQTASTKAYQDNIDAQIKLLKDALADASDSEKASIQRQIDGLNSQQVQITTITKSNAELNSQLQTQIDKGLSQQKQIDLLTSQLKTVSYTVYIVIGIVVIIGIGFLFYKMGSKKKSRRGKR